MPSDPPGKKKKWYAKGRWAIVLVLVGVGIIAFVAATGGKQGAGTLWIAVPLLMVGLGYLFLAQAIPVFLSYDADSQAESDQQEEQRGGRSQ